VKSPFLSRRSALRSGLLPVVLCFCMAAAVRVDAQNGAPGFRRIGVKAGLSSNTVTAITEDARGFLWIGSNAGLNRYDGYTFLHYAHDPSDRSSLSSSTVTALVADHGKNLWIGTSDSGLSLYDHRTSRFVRIRAGGPKGFALSDDRIRCLLEDSKGGIWVGTYNGLNLLDPATRVVRQFLPSFEDSVSLRSESISAITEDARGRVWIGTRAGLAVYDRATGRFSTPVIPGLSASTQSGEYITSLHADLHGRLWYGTANGMVHVFDIAGGRFRTWAVPPATKLADLEGNEITAIHEDRLGRIWIGTSAAGLQRYDEETDSFIRYLHDPSNPLSISENEVRCLFSSREGILWAGTGNEGLNLLTEKPRLFTRLPNPLPGSMPSTKLNVSAFAVDRRGVTWVGTFGKGVSVLDAATGSLRRYGDSMRSAPELANGSVTALLADSRGDVWVGFYEGGLMRIAPTMSTVQQLRPNLGNGVTFMNYYVTSLCEDDDGIIWIGTMGGGLVRHDPADGNFRPIRHVKSDTMSLSSDMVTCLAVIDGSLWVGTYDQGISVFDMRNERMYRYAHTDAIRSSLSSNQISSITRDAGGTIWVGTSDGLNAFDKATNGFSRYSVEDGLSSDLIAGMLPDRHGRIWVSTSAGINRVERINGAVPGFRLGGPTLRVRKYFAAHGLQSNEFSHGAAFRNADGIMLFGGAEGFNMFDPDSIKDAPFVPPIAITDFLLSSGSVQPGDASGILSKSLCESDTIILPPSQKIFSFEFAALSMVDPENNQYAYILEGFDEHWHTTTGRRRFVTYTNLSPGEYVFRVRGCSADGVWNEEGLRLVVIVEPPWWRTKWAIAGYVLLLGLLIFGADRVQRRRVIRIERREAQIREAELRAESAEQNARMKEAQAEAAHAMTKALEAENRRNEVELEKARELEKAYTALDESHHHLKEAQDQLVHAEKMASLGALTAGIAHEIKNPLNFVNNFAKLSKRFVGELREILEGNPDKKVSELGDDVTEILEELTTNSERIFEHGQRADSIVRGMLLHSRGDTGARVKADLNAVVDEAMNLAYHGMRATNSDFNTTLVRDFDKSVGEVEMVSQEISRVCLNLFNNAMYIVHERAEESGADFEPTVTARTNREGDKVHIIISDNGKGMPEEVSKRIFEPFFTTKPAGQGTGLGLSMSYDIVVEGHHGSLVVDSAPGQGAQFTITLPAPL
jgi:ligand-binding sensor domain-containing protein/signal transduction histidine kinase